MWLNREAHALSTFVRLLYVRDALIQIDAFSYQNGQHLRRQNARVK
jgi:hypothetical protein